MKLLLNRSEVENIIASQSLEYIKMYSDGDYKKWDVQCGEDGDGLEIESLFTEKGELKEKFALGVNEVKNGN